MGGNYRESLRGTWRDPRETNLENLSFEFDSSLSKDSTRIHKSSVNKITLDCDRRSVDGNEEIRGPTEVSFHDGPRTETTFEYGEERLREASLLKERGIKDNAGNESLDVCCEYKFLCYRDT